MTLETESVLDRRRLRSRVTFWRVLALVGILAALFAFAASGDQFARELGQPQIARVSIVGTILESRSQLKLLKSLTKSDYVKAVLVYVNSPGGTTTGGEALFVALRELAKKKPVVAQFGTVAASAGYIVGLGADHIVSRGNTVTGSVGVIFQWPEVSVLLEKIGVKINEVKSGPLKANPSPFEPPDAQGREVTEEMVADGFKWFLSLVEERRGIKPENIPGLKEGRIYSGREALSLNLVDEIGGEDEALAWLQEKRNIDGSLKVIDWDPATSSSFGLLSSLGALGARFFGGSQAAWTQFLGRDPTLATLGLDGLVSVWHPSEN